MPNKVQWIKEVSGEIGCSQAALKRAIKDTGKAINSKYDVLLCYAEWPVPKLKDVERQEALYQKRIKSLQDLIHELAKVTQQMQSEFSEQMERKDRLIDTQNQIIAEQARIVEEMEELLRSLPVASGE